MHIELEKITPCYNNNKCDYIARNKELYIIKAQSLNKK